MHVMHAALPETVCKPCPAFGRSRIVTSGLPLLFKAATTAAWLSATPGPRTNYMEHGI